MRVVYHTWAFCLYSASRITRGVYPHKKKNHALLWPHAFRNITSSERFVVLSYSLALSTPCLSYSAYIYNIHNVDQRVNFVAREVQANAKQSLSVGKSVCHVWVFTHAGRKTKTCIARAQCRCSAHCTHHCQSVSARAGRENLTSFGVTVVQGRKHYVS